jgi:hypothetical protein
MARERKCPISPRVIDGNVWHIAGWGYDSTKKAREEADILRKKGYKARIVRSANIISVFKRK